MVTVSTQLYKLLTEAKILESIIVFMCAMP